LRLQFTRGFGSGSGGGTLGGLASLGFADHLARYFSRRLSGCRTVVLRSQ
jgi:hypothetical protein